MTGRNDPCHCGSGKKFKKCCALKEEVTVEAVKTDEIERILQTFYDEYPKQKDLTDYRQFAAQWKKSLIGVYKEEMIEAIALDKYFFHHRPEIWKGFITKQLRKAIRPSVIQLLENWGTPTTLLGQVVETDEETITVYDRLYKKTIRLRRETDKPIPTNVHLWSFTLPENMNDTRLLAVSTLIFFPIDQQSVFDGFISTYEASGMDVEQFMKQNANSMWKQLADNGYKGEEFTDFEEGVLAKISSFLETYKLESGRLLDVVEDYLIEQQPNARKEAAIAAGAIRFGLETGLISSLNLTVKAIAEHFNVSTSSLNRYYNGLSEYASR